MGAQYLLSTHNDIENGVTSQTQNRLHSGISTTKIMAVNELIPKMISNGHGLHESNPHNKSRTCIITTLKLFSKSNSSMDFQL